MGRVIHLRAFRGESKAGAMSHGAIASTTGEAGEEPLSTLRSLRLNVLSELTLSPYLHHRSTSRNLVAPLLVSLVVLKDYSIL